MAEKNNDDERERVMTFVAQELPKFSIKRFNLQNVFDFNNNRPWPVKNSSVAHRLRNPVLDVSTIKINFCVKLAIYYQSCGVIRCLFTCTRNFWLCIL